MNILITLPKHLLDKIISGEKKYEMRKCLPKNMKIGEDGFFVVEKGTDEVRCWCRVDKFIETFPDNYSASWYVSRLCVPEGWCRVDKTIETYLDNYSADWCVSRLCVPEEHMERYANGKKVYLWEIGKVIKLQDLARGSLFVDKNPQQFAYCPLSYGESY